MKITKKSLLPAALLLAGFYLPLDAQIMNPYMDFGCLAPGMMGPCPPPTGTNCTQSSCPLSPPASTTLDKLDPCNPPKIPCANYDPKKDPPENKDGWTKTANGYISNACTIMECVPQNCATSPNIPPCAAEKKAKDDAAKAEAAKLEKAKAQQQADLWAKDHANLNANKNDSPPPAATSAPAGAPGAAPARNGAPAANPDDGVPAPPPSNAVDMAKTMADNIVDANGIDGIPDAPEPTGNYASVTQATDGLSGGKGGQAAEEAYVLKDKSKELSTQAGQTGGDGKLLNDLWNKAAKLFDGLSPFRAAPPEDTMTHKSEALESRKAP